HTFKDRSCCGTFRPAPRTFRRGEPHILHRFRLSSTPRSDFFLLRPDRLPGRSPHPAGLSTRPVKGRESYIQSPFRQPLTATFLLVAAADRSGIPSTRRRRGANPTPVSAFVKRRGRVFFDAGRHAATRRTRAN